MTGIFLSLLLPRLLLLAPPNLLVVACGRFGAVTTMTPSRDKLLTILSGSQSVGRVNLRLNCWLTEDWWPPL